MEVKQYYVFKDFERYALQEFPNEYSTFPNVFRFESKHKTYLDHNNAAHNTSVLSVGHYHRRKGGPLVWAQATMSGVRYFQGKANNPVIAPIPDEQISRIYYDTLYNVYN